MARLTGLFAVAAIVGVTAVSVSAQVLPGRTASSATPAKTVLLEARVSLGSIQGVVTDERGGPLAGAMVSALGAATLMATTDARGRFLIEPLPTGEYQLRVRLPGFVSTRRDGVRVAAATADVSRIQLRRADDSPLSAHPILTAGMSVPS